MNESPTPAPPVRSSWPRAITVMFIFALIVGGAVWVTREVMRAPANVIDSTGALMKEGGRQLRSLAASFNQGTLRTEFLSQATELSGTSRFQFATLKQSEMFKREETGTTAWGHIPLPKVVVQAIAPVEYSYHLDLEGSWQFERDGSVLRVYPPPIVPNTPAMDVSALSFYTLEGSVWRDEQLVKDKLRASLTGVLRERAVKNTALVREIGRQRLADFVQKWLAEKFSDGGEFHVKVIFPEERPAVPVTEPHAKYETSP
jgi:hypothetical protein